VGSSRFVLGGLLCPDSPLFCGEGSCVLPHSPTTPPPPHPRRYAMLVDDGAVKQINMEEGGAFTISGGWACRATLGSATLTLGSAAHVDCLKRSSTGALPCSILLSP